jgi:hypothetical protein
MVATGDRQVIPRRPGGPGGRLLLPFDKSSAAVAGEHFPRLPEHFPTLFIIAFMGAAGGCVATAPGRPPSQRNRATNRIVARARQGAPS